MKAFFKKYALKGGVIAISALLLAQLLPILPPTNPPVVKEPNWNSSETRALAKRACFDCHSNETVWPWYAHVAPMSWLVVYDVNAGRAEFNFSDWYPGDKAGSEADKEIQSGGMPLPQYLLMHPEARLSAAEKVKLRRGLLETMK